MNDKLQQLVWDRYYSIVDSVIDITGINYKIDSLFQEWEALEIDTDHTISGTNTEALLREKTLELKNAERLHYELVRWYPTGKTENMKRSLLIDQVKKIDTLKTSVNFYQVLHTTPKPEPTAYRASHMKSILFEITALRKVIDKHDANNCRLEQMKQEIQQSFE